MIKTPIIVYRISFLLLLISICFLSNTGCSKNSEFDSVPGLLYDLRIEIVDESESDLLDSLPLMDSEGAAPVAYMIDSAEYALAIDADIDSTKLFLKPLMLQNDMEFNRLILRTTTAPGRKSYRPSELTYLLTSEAIFGDRKEHRIVSVWEGEWYRKKCAYIEFDGKRISSSGTGESGSSLFTIVLERE
ncbi:MAG: hypothetical protein ACTHY9_14575 [Sphingobacterium sp.]